MKKKKTGIWIAAITFFTLQLIGTFFHKKIDGLFRMKVAAVYPQECRVETESVIELDGEEIPVTTEEVYLSLPAAAVHCYVELRTHSAIRRKHPLERAARKRTG